MANDWMPIRCALSTTREVVAIARRMKVDRRWVVGALVDFWGWAQNETASGKIVDVDVDACVDTLSLPREFFETLINVGWLIYEGGSEDVPPSNIPSLNIPNFEVWLSDGAKSRLSKNKRQQIWRESKAQDDKNVDGHVADSLSTEASTTEQNRTEHKDNISKTSEDDPNIVNLPIEPPPAPKPKPKPKPKNEPQDRDGRIRFGPHVWFKPEKAEQLKKDLGEALFAACCRKLNNWVSQAAPMPGERSDQKFKDRQRNAYNASHTFSSWVVKQVREDRLKMSAAELRAEREQLMCDEVEARQFRVVK